MEAAINTHVKNASAKKDMRRVRLVLVAGLALVVMVMLGVFVITPVSHTDTLLVHGGLVQCVIMLVALGFTFTEGFLQQRRSAFTLLYIALSVSYMWLSYYFWDLIAVAIPYEGVMLYAFYCIFALGIPYRQAALSSTLVVVVFIALILLNNVYGNRSEINSVFLAASMCVAVYARYRLDNAITLLSKTNKRLAVQSRHDPLSGLLNRRALIEEGEHLLSLSRREDLEIAAIMLDLDEFKKYNDAFGHVQGDDAIRIQADILSNVFKRKTDVLGRYGGEEFLVIVCGLDESELKQQCQRVLSEWKTRALPHSDRASCDIMSCSIGAAMSVHPGKVTLQALIDYADLHLYQAKDAGRGVYRIGVLHRN